MALFRDVYDTNVARADVSDPNDLLRAVCELAVLLGCDLSDV
jgi:hypothetical protein